VGAHAHPGLEADAVSKDTCSWAGCNEPTKNGYCRKHRAEYMRGWRKTRKELARIRDERLHQLENEAAMFDVKRQKA
jgi:hypothetical protein